MPKIEIVKKKHKGIILIKISPMLGKKIVMKITYVVEDILMLKKREKK